MPLELHQLLPTHASDRHLPVARPVRLGRMPGIVAHAVRRSKLAENELADVVIDATGNAAAMCRSFNLVKAMIELEFPKHAEAETVHAPDHRQ